MRRRHKNKPSFRLLFSVLRVVACVLLLLYALSIVRILVQWSVRGDSEKNPSKKTINEPSPPFVFLPRAPPTIMIHNNNTPPFCVDWNQNMDDWWSQHPTWELALQNTTHQCFQSIQNEQQAQLYQQLHQQQQQPSKNNRNCRTKIISNSGWGVDVSYMVDGLQYAVQHETPVHFKWNGPWQYAPSQCPQQDARCLFLPFSAPPCIQQHNQQQSEEEEEETKARYWNTPWKGYSSSNQQLTQWLLQYVTRGQTWLRQLAIHWVDTVPLPVSCDAVIHVRRADVILHGAFSRKYHKIREYVQAYLEDHAAAADRDTPRHILVLTDDANVIPEALEYTKRTQSPWHWYYFDRPRFHGAEGGWENAIPSQDAAMEVAILLASVQLLQRCTVLIHSKSNLADYYFAWMQLANPHARRIDLDANRPHDQIHHAQNAETVRYSRAFSKID